MGVCQGVVARLPDGRYLDRFGHGVDLRAAAVFDPNRLRSAVDGMRAPGRFEGQLLTLFPAEKVEGIETRLASAAPALNTLKFPEPPPYGSGIHFDNGSWVGSLVRALAKAQS